ncbi:IS5 family transposase [Streptomyces lavendulae subsp. grasserius]
MEQGAGGRWAAGARGLVVQLEGGGPIGECLGRSRGGFTTKIHLAADGRCRPLALVLTPGHHGDGPQLDYFLGQISVLRTGAGRPTGFDSEPYKKRNTVDRAVNRLKGFRAVATRYEKRAYTYLGTITLAALVIWLRT